VTSTTPAIAELVTQARAGQVRALARLLSMVDNNHPRLRELLAEVAVPGDCGAAAGGGPPGGRPRAAVVGLTGSPGVGKSTTTSALVSVLRAKGSRVAVLAVDPSSPFSGGALLGDRVRMQSHAGDDGVYIRSLASRGRLGGLSASVPLAVRVLDGVGFDVVLIETVGVGQSEVEVAALADTTVVLLAPGMGDGIQAAKAGILEVGDVFVVNKADRDGAQATVGELRQMVSLARTKAQDWRPPVVTTVASTGQGIDELAEALEAHRAWASEHGQLQARRRRRARDEVATMAVAQLRARIPAGLLEELADAVTDGALDPFAAADALVAEVLAGSTPAGD
jgi:LAO/AO transport system kinase